MDALIIGITIKGFDRHGEPAAITAGELGVLLTASNRVVNYIAYKALTDPEELEQKGVNDDERSPWFGRRSLRYEPDVLVLPIAEVRNGSVILQAAIEFFNLIGLDPETAKNLLLNLIAAGLWDGAKGIYARRAFGAAVQRVARTATGKSYLVDLTIENNALKLKIDISREGKVKVVDVAATPTGAKPTKIKTKRRR